ncbi:MAG: hypothetical protein NUV56_02685 [Candidatus Uhrbacteria bacterium]|nr:hypothetical protein [Candidatus Uhrbacteria bacterium]
MALVLMSYGQVAHANVSATATEFLVRWLEQHDCGVQSCEVFHYLEDRETLGARFRVKTLPHPKTGEYAAFEMRLKNGFGEVTVHVTPEGLLPPFDTWKIEPEIARFERETIACAEREPCRVILKRGRFTIVK